MAQFFMPMATNDFVGIDENPLSENGMWIPNTALSGRMKRQSNTAVFTANLDSVTIYNKFLPANQYAQAQFSCVGTTGTGDGPALVLRCASPTVNTCYRFALDHSATNAEISRFANGSFIPLAQAVVTFNDKDTFTFAMQNQVCFVYRNGVQVMTYDDTAGSGPTAGFAGIGFSFPETSIVIRQFECGAFSSQGFSQQEINSGIQEFNLFKRNLIALQTNDRSLNIAALGSR